MAIINCPDCKKKVSSVALVCLNCGYPIAQSKNISATNDSLTTTQLTSKKYKFHSVISGLLALFVAPVFLIAALLFSKDGKSGEALFSLVNGFVILFYWLFIRFKIWWHHS